MTNCEISVVSPVFQAEKIVDELVARVLASISSITNNFEIILVDDGSSDNSWTKIENNCRRESRIKGLKLSRNFGQHNAITAGLELATGKLVVVMDCDLQDDPGEIPKLYAKISQGFDLVLARRQGRKDFFIKKAMSVLFYKALGYLTDTEQDYTIANFGIYKRPVIEAVLAMKEQNKYFPVMVRWVGFDVAKIDVVHFPRTVGTSAYSFSKYTNLAIKIILSFSEKPLWFAIKIGFIITFISMLIGLYILYLAFSGSLEVAGWASTVTSIWLLGGLIIFIIGVVGLYVGKSFEQVKDRPLYFIQKKININEEV